MRKIFLFDVFNPIYELFGLWRFLYLLQGEERELSKRGGFCREEQDALSWSESWFWRKPLSKDISKNASK